MGQSHIADLSAPMAGNRNRRIAIALYVAATFFYWISLYLYMPTLPIYAQTKIENLALVGAMLSMYGLWQAIIRLPLGICVDWMGRRSPFIILGLALAGLGAWLMGTANTPFEMFVGLSITGIAAAAWVPLVVAFSSLFPADESVRATAILTFVNTIGRLLATSSTGVLNVWGGFSLLSSSLRELQGWPFCSCCLLTRKFFLNGNHRGRVSPASLLVGTCYCHLCLQRLVNMPTGLPLLVLLPSLRNNWVAPM